MVIQLLPPGCLFINYVRLYILLSIIHNGYYYIPHNFESLYDIYFNHIYVVLYIPLVGSACFVSGIFGIDKDFAIYFFGMIFDNLIFI